MADDRASLPICRGDLNCELSRFTFAFDHLRNETMVLDITVTADRAAAPLSAVRTEDINAGRFVLRTLRRSDAGLIGHYTADKRLAEATQSIPHPLPPGAAEAFVARAMSAEAIGLHWVMDGTDTGLPEVLGILSLKPMEGQRAKGGQSEVAYWVAPIFWNTGFASEAVRALIEANPLGDQTYFAEVFQDNSGSARVLTNAGFQYLGDAESFSVARGARVPTWTYTLKLSGGR
jgi:RimJ/RimL family protein N-acetyltransferase